MSMIQCEACDQVFDSDNDPDCFCEVAEHLNPSDIILCERCRDQLIEEAESAAYAESAAMNEAEG